MQTCTIRFIYRVSSISVSVHSNPRTLESFDELLQVQVCGLSFSASSRGGEEVAQFLSEVLVVIGEPLSPWGKLILGKPMPGSADNYLWGQHSDYVPAAYSPGAYVCPSLSSPILYCNPIPIQNFTFLNFVVVAILRLLFEL